MTMNINNKPMYILPLMIIICHVGGTLHEFLQQRNNKLLEEEVRDFEWGVAYNICTLPHSVQLSICKYSESVYHVCT